MLVSENAERARGYGDMTARPLGYVHGVLERIRSEVGPNATLTLEVGEAITVKINNPDAKRTRTFTLAEDDYEHDADRLAKDFSRLFDEVR